MVDVNARLMRAVPLLGFAAHWFQSSERLRIADEEDASYKAMMEAMGAQPQFNGATRARETRIIIGELLGYILATALGVAVALLAEMEWRVAFPAVWIVAFTFDAAGGRLSAALYDREAEARYAQLAEAKDGHEARAETLERDT